MDSTRRGFLVAGGAALTAGCTALSLSGESDISIASVVYRNNAEESRSVHVRLRREDDDADRGFEVVYDEQVTLEGDTLDIVPADWTDERSRYTVLYATDEELEMLDLPEEAPPAEEGGCNHLTVEFTPPDGLTVSAMPDPPVGDAELPSC